MKNKNVFRSIPWILSLVFLLTIPVGEALATTLQVYSPDQTSFGDAGSDEDTWFVSGVNPFELWVLGEFKKSSTTINDLHLIISVPEAESGTVSLSALSSSGTPAPSSGMFYNTKAAITSAVGWDVDKDNHYPFQDAVSDFWVFALGDMLNPSPGPGDPIPDYNAETGIVGADNPNRGGTVWEYMVTFSGYTQIHADVVAMVNGKVKINPGSHDVTAAVPEPATMLLLGSALIGLGLFGRRRFKSRS